MKLLRGSVQVRLPLLSRADEAVAGVAVAGTLPRLPEAKGRMSSKGSEKSEGREGNCLDLDDDHLLKKKGIRLPGSKEPPELREIPEESPSPSPRSTASVTERSARSLVEPVAEISRGPETQSQSSR